MIERERVLHKRSTIYSSHVNVQADELRSMVPTQPSTPLAFTFSTPVYFDTHQVIRELEEAGRESFEMCKAAYLNCGAYCSVVPLQGTV